MKFNLRLLVASLFSISLLGVQPAAADLFLGFSADGGNLFADRFEIGVGDRLEIEVYLRQSDPDTILVDEGLVAWGFDLTRTPTELGEISNASANSAFDFENHNTVTSSGFEWEYGESASLGIRGEAVLLGSFEYLATGAGETTFTIEDRLVGSGVGNASWLTSSFADLDEQIFGAGAADTYGFTVAAVSAVPEPSGCLLLVGGLLLGSVRRKRRLKVGD